MTSTLYNRDLLRLAASIPHHHRLEGPQASVTRRSPVCGSVVTVDIVLDTEGRVREIGQQVSACALGQASAALMGRSIIGRTAEEIAETRDLLRAFLEGSRGDPGGWPGLAALSHARGFPARHASILLAFEAAASAAAQAAMVADPMGPAESADR